MSVEKLDHLRLVKEKHPYTLHMNYVLQNLRDPLSLAIWVYLTSLPDDWKVHRSQLMDHFEVGRDKLGKALKLLNDNKLIEYIQEQLESGKFGEGQILVKCGYEFEVIHRNETALLKNRTTVSPVSGETAPTNTIQNTNTKKDKNKSFCALHETKKPKSVDNQKAENEKQHDFAPMINEKASIERNEAYKQCKPPKELKDYIKKASRRSMVNFKSQINTKVAGKTKTSPRASN